MASGLDKETGSVLIHDIEGRILDATPDACSMYGYNREEFLCLKIQDLGTPYLQHPYHARLERVLSERRAEFVTVHRRRDGSDIPVRVKNQVITWDGQEVVRSEVLDGSVEAWGRDFLEQNRRMDQLNARLASLVRINRLLSASLDLKGVIDTLAHEVRQILPFDRLGVVLERMDGRIELFAQHSGMETSLQPGLSVPWAGSTLEWIQKTGQAWIADLAEKRPFLEDQFLFREGIRAVVRVPIYMQEKCSGLFFLNHRQPGIFREEHLEYLRPVADQLAILLKRQQLYSELHERARQSRAMLEMLSALNATLDLEEVLRLLVRVSAEILPADGAAVGLLAADDCLTFSTGYEMPAVLLGKLRFAPGESSEGEALAMNRPAVISDLQDDPRSKYPELARQYGLRSLCSQPIRLGEKNIGILNVYRREVHQFTAQEIEWLQILAGQAAIAINNARQFREVQEAKEKLEEMSRHDFVTGLFNRQFLEALLEKEIKRARRYHRPLTVAMLDLDNLKLINDTYGHRVGDQVLEAVGQAIRETLRETDIAGRYGGDELAIILPETDAEEGSLAVQRLQEALDRLNDSRRFLFPVQVSIGISSSRDEFQSLVQRADKAMYDQKRKKKRNGR